MTFEELKRKRNYEISDSFRGINDHHTFKTCNKNLAYEALAIMEANGLKTSGDICGSPAVGGYYADGFIK